MVVTEYEYGPAINQAIRFVNHGSLPNHWRRKAVELYEWHEHRVMLSLWTPRSRAGVAAAAVYAAGRSLGYKPTKADCAAACNVSVPTVMRVTRRFKEEGLWGS